MPKTYTKTTRVKEPKQKIEKVKKPPKILKGDSGDQTFLYLSRFTKLRKTQKALLLFLDEYSTDKKEKLASIIKNNRNRNGNTMKGITWVNLADTIFSDFIMIIKSKNGMCTCVTCGAEKLRCDPQMQNGHYRTRGCYLYRFDLDNCFPQCYSCNVIKNGNYRNYYLFMVRTYGENREREIRENKQLKSFAPNELIDMILYRHDEIETKKNQLHYNT